MLARSGGRRVLDEDNAVTAEMSEAFGRLQDPCGCRAKVWIDKRHVAHPEWLNVLRQCGRTCVPDTVLCAQHTRKPPPHTKIGDIMSAELYSKCVKEQARRADMPKVERRGKHWYTRHLMWKNAVAVRRPTESENGVLELSLIHI